MLRLARRDHAAFDALIAASGVPAAVALFHAQQAVEKALKSTMCLYGVTFRRTHDLEQLASQLADAGHAAPVGEAELSRLTPYAVEYRYDDDAPELLSGEQAKAIVESVMAWTAGHCGQFDSFMAERPMNQPGSVLRDPFDDTAE